MDRSLQSATRMGWICLVISVLNYAILWPLMRVGAVTAPALWFGAWRMTTGFAALFIVLAAIGQLRWPRWQDAPAIISVGVFMLGIYLCLCMLGLQYVGAGRATLLGYTTTLWVTPIAIFVLGERLDRMKAAGLALGMVGLVILFNPLDFDWSDRNVVIGNALLLVCAICWAIAMIQLRVHKWNLTPLQLVPWQLICAIIVTNGAAFIFDGDRGMTWTTEMLGLITIAGPVCTGLGIWAVNVASRNLSPITASIGYLAAPVLAMLIGIVALGEPVSVNLIAGMATIIAGIVLVILSGRAARA
ncbi:MAG: DMT family transporter [Alphaproteobacteria bacterium]|nr:DMT family transporter [Alphaproteobacteria bacterium]